MRESYNRKDIFSFIGQVKSENSMFGKKATIKFSRSAFANLRFKSKLKLPIIDRYCVRPNTEFTKKQRNFVEST